jgi:hypothetical protein
MIFLSLPLSLSPHAILAFWGLLTISFAALLGQTLHTQLTFNWGPETAHVPTDIDGYG